MGINEESEYKTFEIELKEDGRFHLKIKEEELVDEMKELMTPFLRRYIHDLIEDTTESMYIGPEYVDDYKADGGPEKKVIDVTISYVTYNDGHFVDPNTHGGPIILSVEEREERNDDEPTIIDGKESDFTRAQINQFQQEESKLRKKVD